MAVQKVKSLRSLRTIQTADNRSSSSTVISTELAALKCSKFVTLIR